MNQITKLELFIPNLKNRYSISNDGIVFSHFRYQNNGRERYRKSIVKKYMQGSSSVVSLCTGKGKKGKMVRFFVNSLTVSLFKIKAPDQYHFYDVVCKDGDIFNNSTSNISHIIRTKCEWEHYPQPFYNKQGRITHKVCGICGDKKTISSFQLQTAKKATQHKTYRNICKCCRSKRQLAAINKNPARLEKQRILSKTWASSPDGIRYFKNYRKEKHKIDRDKITPHYVYTTLKLYRQGLSVEDVSAEAEMIALVRKKILLMRKIRNQKSQIQPITPIRIK